MICWKLREKGPNVWSNKFSVSLFFKRTGGISNYQGIVNNGYYSYGSFEIRMGREGGGTMLGGGIITSHKRAWDHVGLKAALNTWHHVAMVYDGAKLHFWHNGKPEKHRYSGLTPVRLHEVLCWSS